MTRIAIIAALPDEVSMLTNRRLLPGQCIEEGHLFICVSGVGAEHAAKSCKMAHEAGATTLVSWGCAGALSPELLAGDLVIPYVVSQHNNETLSISKNIRHRLHSLLPDTLTVHDGKLIEAPSIIAKQQQKQALYETTHAIAVDMESFQIGQYARQHQLDFLTIRAISDTSNTNLPDIVLSATNDNGQVQIPKVITGALLKPWTLPGLIKLGRQFKQASSTLTTVASQLDQLLPEQASKPVGV